jgi:CIC family chloride channel protein
MADPEGLESRPGVLDPRLPFRSVLVGGAAGLVGGLYRLLLDHVSDWDRRVLAAIGTVPLGWFALAGLFAAAAALARWLTLRGAPEAAGSGIPQVEESLRRDARLPRWHRLLPIKFVAGGLALSGGLSLGREGPTVHLGAAVASGLQRGLGRAARGAILAAGAGAGLTAAFSAPISGFVFVLEELRLEPSRPMVVTALPAVLVSYLVTTALLGAEPLFSLPPVRAPSVALLPLFVSLGLAAGMVGVIFNRGLLWTLHAFDALPLRPSWLGAAAVGVAAAAVGVWLPAALGSGEHATAALVQGRLPLALGGLALLFGMKLALTLASYGCGVPGGIFAPQLLLGATLGAMAHALAPDLGDGMLLPVLATAGMAGVFAASIRAPLTGLVLVVELTHQGHLLLAQATSALAAYLFAAAVRDRPVYEALRERDVRTSTASRAD